MRLGILSKSVKGVLSSLVMVLLPFTCMGYMQGDIDSDNKIGLQESIYALRVTAGTAIPLSGTTINVPSDIPAIQQAIDAASDGDTINIAAGTYNESLSIVDKRIVLSGAGSGSTIIDGGGAAGVVTIEHTSAANISNMTIQNGINGISTIDRSNLELDGAVVRNCSYRGVQIDKNSNGQVSNSTISNNGRDGLAAIRNSSVYIEGNVTTNNNGGSGLFLFLNGTALLDTATFTSNGNGENGIGVHHTSGLYISASTLSMANNVFRGMELSSNSSAGISNDSGLTVTDSQKDGIGVFNTSVVNSRGAITVQRITAGSGINVSESSNLVLNGNVLVTDTSGSGLSISKSSSTSANAKLEILRTTDDGISVARGSSLVNNDTANIIVKNSTYAAIGVYESVMRASGGTFVLQNSTETGLSIGRNSNVELRNNGAGLKCTISNNPRGVEVYRGGALRAENGVTISANTGDGLQSSSSSILDLRNVVITGNGGRGINADDGTDLQLQNSTISANSGGDIALSFGTRATLNGNTLTAGASLNCDATVLSRGDKVCP